MHIHNPRGGLVRTDRYILNIGLPGLVRTRERVNGNPPPQVSRIHQFIQGRGRMLLVDGEFVDQSSAL